MRRHRDHEDTIAQKRQRHAAADAAAAAAADAAAAAEAAAAAAADAAAAAEAAANKRWRDELTASWHERTKRLRLTGPPVAAAASNKRMRDEPEAVTLVAKRFCDDGDALIARWENALRSNNRDHLIDLFHSCLVSGNLDLANSRGHTCIYVACAYSNAELLRALLDAGARVDLVSADGSTPLMMACHVGFVEGVQMLLRRGGCNILQREHQEGKTALHVAIQAHVADPDPTGRHLSCAVAIISHEPQSIHVTDRSGRQPWVYADPLARSIIRNTCRM